MNPSRKFRVYLAGPISRCNPVQRHRWRDEVNKVYGSRITFLDPAEIVLDPEANPYDSLKRIFRTSWKRMDCWSTCGRNRSVPRWV